MDKLQSCVVFCYRKQEFNTQVERILFEKGFAAIFYFSDADQEFILETTERLHEAAREGEGNKKPFVFVVIHEKRMVCNELQFKKKMERKGVIFISIKKLP